MYGSSASGTSSQPSVMATSGVMPWRSSFVPSGSSRPIVTSDSTEPSPIGMSWMTRVAPSVGCPTTVARPVDWRIAASRSGSPELSPSMSTAMGRSLNALRRSLSGSSSGVVSSRE